MDKFKDVIKVRMKLFIVFFTKLISLYSKKSNICLIRLDAIGDFIIWLQTAKYYRLLYPNKKITLICNEAYLEIAQKIIIFDRVIGVNVTKYTSGTFYYFWQITKQINCYHYEVAICDTYSRGIDTSDLMIFLVTAKQKIGFDGDLTNITLKLKKQSDKWYDKLIKIDEDIKFEVNKNFAFVKQLTNHTIEASFINISNLMNNVVGVNRTRAYIVINLGASNICRVWAMEDFAQLINCLDGNVDVVLLGSASEQNLFQQLRPYLTRKINNLIGKTSLLDTINIVASAQLFIGNETSTSHIAAAVNTPSVCILGGGHFARFMPYDLKQEWNWPHAVYHKMDCFNCNWQCVYPLENNQTWRCIARVPVEPVINLVKELLCKKN